MLKKFAVSVAVFASTVLLFSSEVFAEGLETFDEEAKVKVAGKITETFIEDTQVLEEPTIESAEMMVIPPCKKGDFVYVALPVEGGYRVVYASQYDAFEKALQRYGMVEEFFTPEQILIEESYEIHEILDPRETEFWTPGIEAEYEEFVEILWTESPGWAEDFVLLGHEEWEAFLSERYGYDIKTGILADGSNVRDEVVPAVYKEKTGYKRVEYTYSIGSVSPRSAAYMIDPDCLGGYESLLGQLEFTNTLDGLDFEDPSAHKEGFLRFDVALNCDGTSVKWDIPCDDRRSADALEFIEKRGVACSVAAPFEAPPDTSGVPDEDRAKLNETVRVRVSGPSLKNGEAWAAFSKKNAMEFVQILGTNNEKSKNREIVEGFFDNAVG